MERDELTAVTQAFASAARRARAAAFDAVQIHAAHGYLLSQFLSPYFNRRTDAYGGDVTHRARLLLEVAAAVRAEVGEDYPVLVKMNAADFLPGGLSVDDMLRVAGMLEAEGLERRRAQRRDRPRAGPRQLSRVGRPAPGEPEAYYEPPRSGSRTTSPAAHSSVAASAPSSTVERLVAEGATDYISRRPPSSASLTSIARWRAGDRAPARCVSDNGCSTRPKDLSGWSALSRSARLAGLAEEQPDTGE